MARWQANWVADRLTASGYQVALVPIVTRGDLNTDRPIGALSGRGAFTTELATALLESRIDAAVHSLKDLPTEPVEGLMLAAVPTRDSVHDCLVAREGRTLETLPPGALVGTGSARRRAQLLHLRPDLRMSDVRGNVDTRLRKLGEEQYDALILAEAGLRRLQLESAISEVFPTSRMLPAVGQGALGIEVRSFDEEAARAVRVLDDPLLHQSVSAERSLLAALRGGCMAPIAALARPATPELLLLEAVVLSTDGSRRLVASGTGAAVQPEELGNRVARCLLEQGAEELIAAGRTSGHANGAAD